MGFSLFSSVRLGHWLYFSSYYSAFGLWKISQNCWCQLTCDSPRFNVVIAIFVCEYVTYYWSRSEDIDISLFATFEIMFKLKN